MAKGKKKARGSLLAKAGRPAKAGRRKRPGGGHQTSPEKRERAQWLRTVIEIPRESLQEFMK